MKQLWSCIVQKAGRGDRADVPARGLTAGGPTSYNGLREQSVSCSLSLTAIGDGGSRRSIRRQRQRLILAAATSLAPVLWSGPAAAAEGAITIDARFQEEHVRVGDPLQRPIVWANHLSAVFSGGNNVQESWESSSNRGFTRNGVNGSVLGTATQNHIWHVLGAKSLVRTQEFLQHVMTITIVVQADKACRLKVDYRLKPGYQDMLVPAADSGMLTHFTLPRTLAASCTIS